MFAGEIAKALKGRRAGRHKWTARCPAHPDRNPSLSISTGCNGRALVHCFAGCSQDQVIDALKGRGLWHSNIEVFHPAQEQRHFERDDASRIEYARSIWNTGIDPRDTPAEAFLTSRKLFLPPELSGTVLRFHPACPWEKDRVPCLIAAFTDFASDAVKAIHRIRVDQPQRWPKTDRKMLGPVAGSAVKLGPLGESLVVGEGVETSLAARQLGLSPVWALGSAANIETFAPVTGVDTLVILGENDGGKNRRAADACRQRWQPRCVRLLMPNGGRKDFNDLLLEPKK